MNDDAPEPLASQGQPPFATPPRRFHISEVTRVEAGSPPFLTLRRVVFTVDNDPRVVRYDVVERVQPDAAVVVAYSYFSAGGPETQGKPEIRVWLRTVVRPPIVLGRSELPGDQVLCTPLWEVAAGLVDDGETPKHAALRELHEELGFAANEAQIRALGAPLYGAAGVLAERLYFFAADVTGLARALPLGDGSPLEDDAHFVELPLEDAIFACTAGEVQDLKTELILRRLQDICSKDVLGLGQNTPHSVENFAGGIPR